MVHQHFDVLIIGAGLSGIAMAWHLQDRCPDKSFAILEARDVMGGTWDLFRYPGVRSDSDMFTLGYSFRPWHGLKAIADGDSILQYIKNTASEAGLDKHIHYGHRVTSASWSSANARWTLTVAKLDDGSTYELSCYFLISCTGYYTYDKGYTAEIADRGRYDGTVVHPQHWPADLDYAGKRIIVIGSGATAMTLAPALASSAAHVTMLQRSPTYVVSLPAADGIANRIRSLLPAGLAHRIIRRRNILMGLLAFRTARRNPEKAKQFIADGVRGELGDGYDIQTHFTPKYQPWDQRVCVVPDGDLFAAIREQRVSIVTDRIACFTKTGLQLQSGVAMDADIVVTATGLNLLPLGGIAFDVDGAPISLCDELSYKGMMISNMPNMASAFGYTNASWTLKCELMAKYICRLLNHMDRQGIAQCTPRKRREDSRAAALLDFSSGYVERSISQFAGQGRDEPWRVHQNYIRDWFSIRLGPLDDGVLESRKPAKPQSTTMAVTAKNSPKQRAGS